MKNLQFTTSQRNMLITGLGGYPQTYFSLEGLLREILNFNTPGFGIYNLKTAYKKSMCPGGLSQFCGSLFQNLSINKLYFNNIYLNNEKMKFKLQHLKNVGVQNIEIYKNIQNSRTSSTANKLCPPPPSPTVWFFFL